MATSYATPPPSVPSRTTSFNEEEQELISITPWTTTRRSHLVPSSLSPSKRVTRSSRNSLAVTNENDSLRTKNNTPPAAKSGSLLDAVTPSFRQTTLSTPLVPSSHLGLPRSALKKHILPSNSTPLQSRDTNSPSGTPIRENPTATTTEGGGGGEESAGTPNMSPTKTLRFDQDVIERELAKSADKKGNTPKQSSLNTGEDEEEWVSESEEELDESNVLQSGPSTPGATLPLHLLPQTPTAYLFSPGTPMVRTHQSYDDDELTDCDADFSVYEEDSSFAFTNIGMGRRAPEYCLDEEVSGGEDAKVQGLEMVPEEGETFPSFEDESSVEDEDNDDDELVDETDIGETDIDAETPGTGGAGVSGGEAAESRNWIREIASNEVGFEVTSEKPLPKEEEGFRAVTTEGRSQLVEGLLPEEEQELSISDEASDSMSISQEEEAKSNRAVTGLDDTSDSEVDIGEEAHTPELPNPTADAPPSPFLDTEPLPPPTSAELLATSSLAGAIAPPVPAPAVSEPESGTPATPSKPESDVPTPRSTSKKPAVVTPNREKLPSQPLRTGQPQIHDAPTAFRQLTKLSSLASKRSFDSLQDPKRRTGLTTMVSGSTSTAMSKLPSTVKASATSTSLFGGPRPTPAGSRLAVPPPSAQSRAPGEPAATSQPSTVDKKQDRAKPVKPSSSLPTPRTLSTSMRPPTSTIPRSRPPVARSGIKPPSATLKTTTARPVPAPARGATVPTKPSAPPTKLSRSFPLPSSNAKPVVTIRSARPDTSQPVELSIPSLPSPAPRQLPALQQTTSAPSVLGASARGPTPPLQQAQANQLPPVPRSARPAPQARPPSASAATLIAPSSNASVRTSSPQKRRPLQSATNPGILPESRPIVQTGSCQSAENPVREVRTLALAPSPLVPVSDPSPIFSSPSNAPIRSPRRAAPVSPLRSPRRVPLSEPIPPPFPVPAQQLSTGAPPTGSALMAPADKIAAGAASTPMDVFGPAPSQPVPVRSSRLRTTRTVDEDTPVAPVPPPVKRLTRRTAAAAASTLTSQPLSSAPPAAPKSSAPLIPRSSRRPPKPSPSVNETPENVSSEPARPLQELPLPLPVPSASIFLSNPAPLLTQEELNRLTQRNTKRNQQSFNKIKIETVYLEENRPPSPTSKIRKSFGSGDNSIGGGDAASIAASREASKEGREARAAKRRRALRSSTDGSELEALRAELNGEDGSGDGSQDSSAPAKIEPMLHFRAPGDEEQFSSPARAVKKSGTKKKSSSTTTTVEKKQVRWDKALVYEGPKEDALPDSANGIIKHAPLDNWGNSTDTSTNFAKPTPVVIRKRIFKDDEQ